MIHAKVGQVRRYSIRGIARRGFGIESSKFCAQWPAQCGANFGERELSVDLRIPEVRVAQDGAAAHQCDPGLSTERAKAHRSQRDSRCGVIEKGYQPRELRLRIDERGHFENVRFILNRVFGFPGQNGEGRRAAEIMERKNLLHAFPVCFQPERMVAFGQPQLEIDVGRVRKEALEKCATRSQRQDVRSAFPRIAGSHDQWRAQTGDGRFHSIKRRRERIEPQLE